MSDFLKRMAEGSARRLAEARARTAQPEMRRAAEHMPPARPLKLAERPAVIAEIKRVAPSVGVLSADVDVVLRATKYAEGGAAAISVLTEPEEFRGSLDDLRAASAASSVPVMRKDFLVEPCQLFEARACGADGALLIAACLDDATLTEMLHTAEYLGMFALVEAFDELDIERAQRAGARIVGVNCRNLRDLSIDFERFEKLRLLIDSDHTAIAESGITTPEQFQRVAELGYHAALIGSALMREQDPAVAIASFRAAVPVEGS
ncbi:MAG: indole-3-glycerol-phosphate synthase [Planctomycetes bacterium]|nr:indole-3-glycerol-phosphate synthase [Planctomycetota bacterium]